jgi:hypothetical protein
MNAETGHATRQLEALLDSIDIPPSYYQKATGRYDSLGEWFQRKGSIVAEFNPATYPQGSFRYGTVVRPLLKSEEYDLDLVCQLDLSKRTTSQRRLRELLGREIKAYARANGIQKPPKEKRRCWRLDYADDIRFHMDILPAIPDDEQFKRQLVASGVVKEHAEHAVAITDSKHLRYKEVHRDWPTSNPKGFAMWFESKMKSAAQPVMLELVARHVYASVDDVPPYEWKTSLQRAIQLLKRHRDVMFRNDPDNKPISMIITTLAALSYQGDSDLHQAIANILENMAACVKIAWPKVPNPVNPAEDFADKWRSTPVLERSFRLWLEQAKAGFGAFSRNLERHQLQRLAAKQFAVELSDAKASSLVVQDHISMGARESAPSIVNIGTSPKPWARDA